MEVIPAILTESPDEFREQIEKLQPYFHRFQIDVADNTLVPNTTLQIEEIHEAIQNSKLKIENLIFDFHLMVSDYEKHLRALQELSKNIKINVVFIHASCNPNYELLSTNYQHFSFGLVLNPEDEVDTIKTKYDFGKLDHVQIMTIVPGFQGQSFIPEMLQKIQQIRAVSYRPKIYLDGSINDKTIPQLMSLTEKPDFLGIGSFLTKAENIEERVKTLKKILKQVQDDKNEDAS